MFTDADLLEMHRRMLTIRGFEERVAALYRDGEVPGFVHLSTGQEASAVGACWPLGPADVITSTHRGHGHCLAKGLAPLGMFAELMGKDEGTNRGRGGSMHIADPNLGGSSAANGIVAAGLPIAVGAATAAWLRAEGNVAVAFFGDGALAQGALHEAVNLAAVWQLPVIFLCENNGYAEFSTAAAQHAASLEQRAAGYGVDYVAVDGNDVVATAIATHKVVSAIPRGTRPRHHRGSHLPLATATTRATRSATGHPTRFANGRRGIRSSSTRAGSDRLASVTMRSARWRHRFAHELDEAVDSARQFESPAAATLTDFVVRPPTRARPAAGPGRRRPGVSHHGRGPRRPRSRARRRRSRLRRRHRRRCRRQCLRAHARAPRSIRGSRPRHPHLGDRDRGASASARRWRGCAPWWS